MTCCTPSSNHRNTVVDILTFHYIFFEAAMTSHIPRSVISLKHLLDFKEGPCWQVSLAPLDAGRGALPTDADPAVVAALKKWNLCDHFCYLFYENLKKVLAREGAGLQWMIYRPTPEIFFADGTSSPVNIHHSALQVQLKDGEVLMFDGTGEQFGWPASEWLTCSRCHPEFKKQKRDGEEGDHVVWAYHKGGFEDIVRAFEEEDDGYWARISGAFHEMFDNLDWKEIKRGSRAIIEPLFLSEAKKRAEKAARGTWGP